jgi:hypothetical protein
MSTHRAEDTDQPGDGRQPAPVSSAGAVCTCGLRLVPVYGNWWACLGCRDMDRETIGKVISAGKPPPVRMVLVTGKDGR